MCVCVWARVCMGEHVYMGMGVDVRVHGCVHVCVYTEVCVCVHGCVRVCVGMGGMCAWACVCVRARMGLPVCVQMCVYVWVCMGLPVCVQMCVYVRVCIGVRVHGRVLGKVSESPHLESEAPVFWG